jgi:hypothetical protein
MKSRTCKLFWAGFLKNPNTFQQKMLLLCTHTSTLRFGLSWSLSVVFLIHQDTDGFCLEKTLYFTRLELWFYGDNSTKPDPSCLALQNMSNNFNVLPTMEYAYLLQNILQEHIWKCLPRTLSDLGKNQMRFQQHSVSIPESQDV